MVQRCHENDVEEMVIHMIIHYNCQFLVALVFGC